MGRITPREALNNMVATKEEVKEFLPPMFDILRDSGLGDRSIAELKFNHRLRELVTETLTEMNLNEINGVTRMLPGEVDSIVDRVMGLYERLMISNDYSGKSLAELYSLLTGDIAVTLGISPDDIVATTSTALGLIALGIGVTKSLGHKVVVAVDHEYPWLRDIAEIYDIDLKKV